MHKACIWMYVQQYGSKYPARGLLVKVKLSLFSHFVYTHTHNYINICTTYAHIILIYKHKNMCKIHALHHSQVIQTNYL